MIIYTSSYTPEMQQLECAQLYHYFLHNKKILELVETFCLEKICSIN